MQRDCNKASTRFLIIISLWNAGNTSNVYSEPLTEGWRIASAVSRKRDSFFLPFPETTALHCPQINHFIFRMDKIMALRKEINATYEKEGVKLSVNDFVIKAVALACKRVPDCNSAWMETFIRLEQCKE